ncbi:hypothetical protein D8X55_04160 [Malacoplasma penetrans]|uniref:Trigger factor C-terminal domain-containing protein n=1 Tax=Malacoplasma penetrans (strain HF-2) TaxID=272633 RepID=Q8EWJ9_MALP2|nr:hypothetical protein [Malacoplasma penetrans]RXY96285.1 hypothetical protein D8X55_04160 [Malacoplasma penetrans]BAC43995.1 conserved hypothetical protein [Malacoplasma penetrans HF-2]
MITFKSTAKQKFRIDYNKQFVIEQLFADPKMLDVHVEKIRSVYKDASDNFIRNQIDHIIIKENAFNEVMKYLVELFEFTYDETEVGSFRDKLKTTMTNLNDSQCEDLARKLIQKGLIFKVLARDNKLEVSDDDAKKYLEQYYKTTNNSINEFLNNNEKFDEIKDIILEEKITQWVISKFKISLTIQNILNRQVPVNENAAPQGPAFQGPKA